MTDSALSKARREAHRELCCRLNPNPPCDGKDKHAPCYRRHQIITRLEAAAREEGEKKALTSHRCPETVTAFMPTELIAARLAGRLEQAEQDLADAQAPATIEGTRARLRASVDRLRREGGE